MFIMSGLEINQLQLICHVGNRQVTMLKESYCWFHFPITFNNADSIPTVQFPGMVQESMNQSWKTLISTTLQKSSIFLNAGY
jgi:hypothetical protein